MSNTATEDPTLQTNILPDLPMEDEPQTPPAGDTPPTDTPPAAPPAGEDLTKRFDELASKIGKVIEPKVEPPKQPTQEEIDEFWAVYDPEMTDKEFFKKFGRFGDDATPEQIEAFRQLFGGMQKGMMKQAVTAAKNYVQMLRDELEETYAPVREYVENAKREATRGRFYGEYPALQDKKFQTIIDATARTLDNKSFSNEGEYFKALAEGAAGTIKEILPDFDLGAKPTTKKPGQTPRLPRSTAGSGGGAGKGATHDVLASSGRSNDIDSLSDDAE